MALINTINFLPKAFQTVTNRRLLGATMDQLVTDEVNIPLKGYIGRTFAPTYKLGDNYVPEHSTIRSNYQLEAGVVIKNNNNNIQFNTSYIDLLNSISSQGGLTNNHQRLFSSESYSYDGHFDYDKFVNYYNYYWMPDGPLDSNGNPVAVTVSANNTPYQANYTVTRNTDIGGYVFSGIGLQANLPLTLARGGTYKFIIDQPGSQFWIQTIPGTSGHESNVSTISTRKIYGVTNNGTDVGVVTFNVPQANAQDFFADMTSATTVDAAATFAYSDIQNHLLSDFLSNFRDGIDGVNNLLENKTFIFISNEINDNQWTTPLPPPGYSSLANGIDFKPGKVVPMSSRNSVWQIKLTSVPGNDYLIQLIPGTTVKPLQKVFISSGKTYASNQFWLNNSYQYQQVPIITAPTDYLYYQDSSDPNFTGVIKLVDNSTSTIDVTRDIIGQLGYTSPNGISFTNGLKIQFDTSVTPGSYSGNTYYVEGVGIGIKLIPENLLIVPETFGKDINTVADYITINRGSQDLNPWTRSNRWLHKDVIEATASYNNSVANFGINLPARRPIIEFEAGLQLFNFGKEATTSVNYITFDSTNAFAEIEGQQFAGVNGVTAGLFVVGKQYVIQSIGTTNFELIGATDNKIGTVFTATGPGTGTGVASANILKTGDLIIFANDRDPTIINQIWQVTVQEINALKEKYITLVKTSADPLQAVQNLIVTDGLYAGRTFNYTGLHWVECQHKYRANQPPLFDVVDSDGYSYADSTVYPKSTFAGTPIFGYNIPTVAAGNFIPGTTYTILSGFGTTSSLTDFTLIGASANEYGVQFTATSNGTGIGVASPVSSVDPILGFPLQYQTFNNIGDISFRNFYDTDAFSYSTKKNISIDSGYLIKNSSLGISTKVNTWVINVEPTEQFQIFTKFFDGHVITLTSKQSTTNLISPKNSIGPISPSTASVEYAFVQVDILPTTQLTVPHVKVYLNNKLLVSGTDYALIQYGPYYAVVFMSMPTIGDKINVAIFSNVASKLGHYEIPNNLDFNALNENFNTITLGQLRTHYNKLVENTSVGSTKSIPLQDNYLKQQGGTLLQHSSPLIYAMTFLSDPVVNFVNGLELARKEYAKFKNKFLSLCASSTAIDYDNPVTGVDTLLKTINLVKNDSFPWYYSDMVPQGDSYSTITYTVLSTRQTNYEISSIFDNTKLSNRAVLIYVNNIQQVLGNDYTISQISPAIIFNKSLTIGDIITIRDYSNTDGNYIPETPTKLGLYPKFTPQILVDNTYQAPTTMIQGHDGSMTPAFGDFRDQYLLELELRIYNNLKNGYKKIIDLYDVMPGRFRTTDYTSAEFNQVLSQGFLTWAGSNNVDYALNASYNSNNPKTWNFSEFTDSFDGSLLQGSWRAIYSYWFDTETPHMTPWEMLGFSERPNWWITRYGPSPYTSGNRLLWEDLELGYIWNGNNSAAYNDARFTRPGLTGNVVYTVNSGSLIPGVPYKIKSTGTKTKITDFTLIGAPNNNIGTSFVATGPGTGNGIVTTTYTPAGIIPVDSAGNLLDPTKISLIKKNNSATAGHNFSFGQQSPAEFAWRQSSDYAFSLQLTLALTRPAEYFSTQIDTADFFVNTITNQFSNSSNQCISPKLLSINGRAVNGVVERTAGYINWIADGIKNLGIDPISVIAEYFSNLSVQLSYKLGGFTDQTMLTVTAEQTSPGSTNSSVIVPDSNYQIYLNKSTPVGTVVYSAVVVEKTTTGYAVSGYNPTNPFFYIIPSLANSNTRPIDINGTTVNVYQDNTGTTQPIPYGTEFATIQQVADFLISYERYLIAQGFVFTQFNQDLESEQNWTLSVQELVYWSQQGWSEGNIIVLTPAATNLQLKSVGAVVDKITNIATGSSLLNQNFQPIKSNSYNVLQEENITTPNLFVLRILDGSTICYAKLNLIQYEHVLVFDNVDDFGDIIYIPKEGTRQYRLGLTGQKTGAWTGALSAPGYIYNSPIIQPWASGVDYRFGDIVTYNNFYYTAAQDIPATPTFNSISWSRLQQHQINTGLLQNFGLNASQFNNIYDIDNPPSDSTLQEYSAGLIGFRQRQYLTDLGVSLPTQTKFYQGYIKEKGSINSIRALTKASFNNIQGNISLYEEWAFQSGIYGGVSTNTFKEFVLDQSVFNTNPAAFTVTDTYNTANVIIDLTLANIYNSSNISSTVTSIYSNRVDSVYMSDLPSVGYANLNDVDHMVFDINTYLGKLNVNDGDKIWVAKDPNQTWNIYRATDIQIEAITLTYVLDSVAQLEFSSTHSFVAGDIFELKTFDDIFDGVYSVVSVANATTIVIQLSDIPGPPVNGVTPISPLQTLIRKLTVAGTGKVYKFITAVVDTIDDLLAMSPPPLGWVPNECAWVNNATATFGWGVYRFSNENDTITWSRTRSQEPAVDINSISRTFIYNKTNNNILAALDYVDPAKGKILNIAAQDINYCLDKDPAVYNAGLGNTIKDLYWGSTQVGTIWWNLDTVRYINYEQDSLLYRLTNWGATFPGSSIDVYQWIKSSVLPSQYVDAGFVGTPLYVDDSAYSIMAYVDQANGTVNNNYYFWVKNISTVMPNKNNSLISLTSIIKNPMGQGLAVSTVLRDDSVAFYNVNNLLVGKNSVVNLGSQAVNQNLGSNIIHSEYALVEENNPNSRLPNNILNKLIDSLSGIDRAGNAVPDPLLPPSQAYGINIRPRQSMIVNNSLALSNYLSILNPVLLAYPVVENKVLTILNSGQAMPNPNTGAYSLTVNTYEQLTYINDSELSTGYSVLVIADDTQSNKWSIYTWNGLTWVLTQTQSYLTSNFWSYADWYASGYNPTTTTNITVANKLEFGKLTLTPNTYIKILDNGSGNFVVYQVDNLLNINLVGIQNGTIQITGPFVDNNNKLINQLELRQILIAMQTQIFIDDLATEYNKIFFSMIKYILTEQKNVDWVFKTSFISATQEIRKLQQFPIYAPDNQNFYLSYIEEVKPYRTQIREFVVNYIGEDNYGSDITDFDLPPTWDANLQLYRSPDGSQSYDRALQSTGINSQWYNNHTYRVTSIIVDTPGSGFISPPVIAVVGNSIVPATAISTLTNDGGIKSITVTNPGSGYTSTPTIVINGTGSGATAHAVINNVYAGNQTGYNTTRSIATTIKFDRTTYTNSNTFVLWDNITIANIGQTILANTVIVLHESLYRLSNTYTIAGNLITNTVLFPPLDTVTTLSASDFDTALDRIVAFNGNIDLNLINDGTVFPGIIVDGNTFIDNTFDNSVQSFYSNVFGTDPNSITIDGGAYIDAYHSHAPEELIPGRMYDNLNLRVTDTNHLSFRLVSDLNQVQAYYRIAAENSTTVTANLSLTDKFIYVGNAATLPPPIMGYTSKLTPTMLSPGVVFINGEEIYYGRNFAHEVPTPWEPNTAIATNTLISFSNNLYLITGNVYATTFANILGNVTRTTANALGQLRRGVNGTAALPVHLIGSSVQDAGLGQKIPYTDLSTITTSVDTTYNTAEFTTYGLNLTTPLSGNIGDLITQYKTYSNVVILSMKLMETVTNAKSIPVLIYSGLREIGDKNNFYDGQYGFDSAGTDVNDVVVAPVAPVRRPGDYLPTWSPDTEFGISDSGSAAVEFNGNVYLITGNVYGSTFASISANLVYDPSLTIKFKGTPTQANLTLQTGDQWINTVSGQVSTWTGTTWAPIVSSGIGFDSGITGLYINGNLVPDCYTVSAYILGKVNNQGQITVPAGTTLTTGLSWYSPGISTPSDGRGLINSYTLPATFLQSKTG